jgi:hypothetical protein
MVCTHEREETRLCSTPNELIRMAQGAKNQTTNLLCLFSVEKSVEEGEVPPAYFPVDEGADPSCRIKPIRERLNLVRGRGREQLITHSLILFPFPTLQTKPFSSKSREFAMLLHANEGLYPTLACIKVPLGLYVSHIIWATRDSGYCRRCHPCFASKAVLNMARSRKPIPPYFFDMLKLAPTLPMDSLLIRLSPPPVTIHQGIHISAKLFRELEYTRAICRYSLSNGREKSSFPAWDKNFSFHPTSFFCTLPLMASKILTFDRPTKIGTPRYFSKQVTTAVPELVLI